MNSTAIVAAVYGGPEVLELIEREVPGPGPGDVLIEVRAAGTNPIDYKIYRGGPYGSDPSRLPMPLGFEVAGVVRTVGSDVVGPTGPISVGDEVVGFRVTGGYASALTAPAASVLAKPTTLSFEEASGLMLVGVTAVHALTVVGAKSGETLLLHGAAGGVGLAAVQIAVADGARVIATASTKQHEQLRALGAEPVTYGEGLEGRVRELAPEGVDAAIDLIGNDEAADVSFALVSDHNRIATIVGSGKAGKLGAKALGNGPGADPGTEIRDAARLDLLRRVEAGTLRVFVAATYPLAEAAKAHRELADGHVHGKIVLIA